MHFFELLFLKDDIISISKKIINDGLEVNEYLLASKLYIPYGYEDETCTIYYSKSILNAYNLGGRCDLLPNINLKSLLINEEYYEPTLDVEEGS